jgi:leucyl-tRNA synthetase
MNFREAMVEAWDKLQNARDKYRAMTGPVGMHKDLVLKFIENETLIMSPIIPHYAEHVWGLLGNASSVMSARWPEVGNVDPMLIRQVTYFDKVLSDARSKVEKARTKAPCTKLIVYVAENFLDWQQAVLNVLNAHAQKGGGFDKDFKKSLMSIPELQPFKAQSKLLMPFAAFVIDEFPVRGAEAFELKVPFDEVQILKDSVDYINKELAIEEMVIEMWPPADVKKLNPATPGKPTLVFV